MPDRLGVEADRVLRARWLLSDLAAIENTAASGSLIEASAALDQLLARAAEAGASAAVCALLARADCRRRLWRIGQARDDARLASAISRCWVPDLLARCLYVEAVVEHERGDLRQARRVARQARSAVIAADVTLGIAIEALLAIIEGDLGSTAAGETRLRALLRQCDTRGEFHAVCLHNLAVLQARSGNDDAEGTYLAAIEAFSRQGQHHHQAVAAMNLAIHRLDRHELDSALPLLDSALAYLGDDPGAAHDIATCLVALGVWARQRALPADAERVLSRAERDLIAVGAPAHDLAVCRRNLAAVLARLGNRALAERKARESLAGFREAHAVTDAALARVTLANILAVRAEPSAARESERLLQSALRVLARSPHHALQTGYTLRALAGIHQRLDAPDTETTLRAALRTLVRAGPAGRREAAICRLHHGAYLLSMGRTRQARRVLGRACRAFDVQGEPVQNRAQADSLYAAALLARHDQASVRHAVPAALIVDAYRHEIDDPQSREHWRTQVVAPAMEVAFEAASMAGDDALIADLIATVRLSGALQGEGDAVLAQWRAQRPGVNRALAWSSDGEDAHEESTHIRPSVHGQPNREDGAGPRVATRFALSEQPQLRMPDGRTALSVHLSRATSAAREPLRSAVTIDTLGESTTLP
ncbi:MAG: hypothetical protein ACK5MT_17355 [Actinomycetales bacterium]